MGILFGTDGIRGIANEDLDLSLARRVGEALTKVLISEGTKVPEILIGMDTRQSSPALCTAIMNGICESGGKAVSIGVCSTPMIAYHIVRHSFDGGVMISASHNPYKYNGIKIFANNGRKISDEIEEKIETLLFEKEITPDLARRQYIDYIKEAFGVSLDGLKIGIDCANGSATVTAKDLFSGLGAECHIISDNPDGKNINEKCGSTHLDSLKKLVLANHLDVGIAFDGDADRCIAIDENGEEIDGDFIMAILALRLKSLGMLKQNTIVGTVMTNLGLKKFCEENEITFKSSPVGDRFVLEMMTEEGYSLGGEQSGHIILSQLATTGDGQLTAVALLSEIKRSGKSLSTLASIMKKYPQITVNLDADNFEKKLFLEDELIKAIISEAELQVKNTGRIIVRPSGTEPFIRITAESKTEKEAKEICNNLANKIKDRLNELKTAMR